MDETANLVEIFSSFQGEGIYIGKRQLFIRFAFCNLNCGYCDTPIEDSLVNECLIERNSGSGVIEKIKNPFTVHSLLGVTKKFLLKNRFHHSISLTGGEPLLYTPFLEKLLSGMNAEIPVYLETNGTLFEELESILRKIDIISMDIKLPDTGGIDPQWDAHKKFLRLANKKEVFVKTVVGDCTTKDEFVAAVELVSEVEQGIPFIIQPLTIDEGRNTAQAYSHLFEFYEYASSHLKDVRIIPQSHKMMGIL